MKLAHSNRAFSLSIASAIPLSLVILTLSVTTGCGGSGGAANVNPVGNTAVTLLVSSQGNDEVYQINLGLTEVTLTSKSGKNVTILSQAASQSPTYDPEFVHLNGSAEPVVTVNVPQHTYTSASVSFTRGELVCMTKDAASGGLHIYHWDYDYSLTQAKVQLPSPITVMGTNMGLSLEMLVGQSSSITSCDGGGSITSSLPPTFSLSAAPFASSPTNFLNGKETGIFAEVDSLDENGAGFSALFPHDPIGSTSYSDASSYIVPVTVNSETTYQGISGLSSLAKGVKLEMDLEYGADGTAVATRIAVPDLTATNAQVGELGFVTTDFSEIQIFPRQALGNDDYGDNQDFSVGSAAFLISGQFTNMKSLPFPAKFNASSLAAGQQIFVTSPPLPTTGAQPFAKATSITLVPQTINGTVGATSSSGGFQVYTVTLASYDPISILSSIANQITPPQQQTQLQVYVDGNTQKLNTQALEIGGTLRFTGLLLNDAGTLRMDCSQILDGVSD